ncbi:ABC transporter permease [Tsukamurella pseudospumae]|uniref:ABC transporter permease n=1 Tax=Tsukamurella pseudospumae TaxID=239498 RepID=A0A137ZDF6_9ACTN|nr:ABC transporter permease [Tsukamurella pseudospumae]KXO96205.1 ABC transporter permease [Tsukamurella pseudospumae]
MTAGSPSLSGLVPGLVAAVRSEAAKLSGRSPAIAAGVPLAIAVPLLVNYVIAEAVERNKINGAGGMDTSNAAYWVLVFSTYILVSGVVYSTAGEFGNGTIDLVFARQPRRWFLPTAKVAVFGAVAAGTSAVTVAVLMVGFPRLYPDTWGRVELFSGAGIRLWCGIPLYMVLVTMLGVGLATLLPKPGLVLTLLLLWRFGVETFVTFIRGDLGLVVQRWSPFRNADLGVGQLSTITSPFGGPNGSLAYFGLVCVVVFAAGVWKMVRADITR